MSPALKRHKADKRDPIQKRLKAALEVPVKAHLWTPAHAIRFVPPVSSTVYGDGRFIGEGITEPVPPRASVVVPFALEEWMTGRVVYPEVWWRHDSTGLRDPDLAEVEAALGLA